MARNQRGKAKTKKSKVISDGESREVKTPKSEALKKTSGTTKSKTKNKIKSSVKESQGTVPEKSPLGSGVRKKKTKNAKKSSRKMAKGQIRFFSLNIKKALRGLAQSMSALSIEQCLSGS